MNETTANRHNFYSHETDRKLRESSLASLQAFLCSRKTLPDSEARKLWTGLYYALWMTDRPKPQQRLAASLADLLSELQPGCAAPWLAAFWAVLSSQWPHIEALRLDKFLLLVRRVFAAQVRWVRDHGYESSPALDGVMGVFAEWCFDAEDEHKVALGLRLHVLDIWVDELEREGVLASAKGEGEEEGDPKAKAFVETIGALVDLLKRCPVKSVRQRAVDSHEDEKLPWVEVEEDAMDEDDEEDEDEDGGWGGISDD